MLSYTKVFVLAAVPAVLATNLRPGDSRDVSERAPRVEDRRLNNWWSSAIVDDDDMGKDSSSTTSSDDMTGSGDGMTEGEAESTDGKEVDERHSGSYEYSYDMEPEYSYYFGDTDSYVGCFQDYMSERPLEFGFGDMAMTPLLCRELCFYEGAAYMALEIGYQCWCGFGEEEDFTKGGSAVCDKPCAGDPGATCGGVLTYDLYKISGEVQTPSSSPTSSPTEAVDSMCDGEIPGVQSGNACCVAACGTCGGAGCSTRDPLTADDCCTATILEMGSSCAVTGAAPCIISEGDLEETDGPAPVPPTPVTPAPTSLMATATRAPVASPTNSPVPRPTPTPEASLTPSPVVSEPATPYSRPTPTSVASPTPSPVMSEPATPYSRPTPTPVVSPTPSPVMSEPTTPSSDSSAPSTEGMDTLLELHNEARCNHGAEPLVWSSEVESYAKDHAAAMQSACSMFHSESEDRNGYGENVFATSGSYSPDEAMYYWYDDEVQSSSVLGYEGHATQILWKSTTELGCALGYCGDTTYLVCQYNPPGNYAGMYEEEVGLSSGGTC